MCNSIKIEETDSYREEKTKQLEGTLMCAKGDNLSNKKNNDYKLLKFIEYIKIHESIMIHKKVNITYWTPLEVIRAHDIHK